MMKKFMIAALSLVLIVAAAFGIFAKFYMEPQLKRLIEEKGSAALGSPLTISGVRVRLLPPAVIELQGLEFELKDKGLKARLPRTELAAKLGLHLLDEQKPLGLFQLRLIEPEITFTQTQAPAAGTSTGEVPASPASPQKASGLPLPPRDFHLQTYIERGRITAISSHGAQAVEIADLSLQFDLPSIKSPASLVIKTNVALRSQQLNLRVPVTINSQLQYSDEKLQSLKTTGSLMGLEFELKGFQNLVKKSNDWHLQLSAPDLRMVQFPDEFKSHRGQWQGRVETTVRAQNSKTTTWKIDSFVKLAQVNGPLDTTLDGSEVHGRVGVDGEARIIYNNGLSIPAARVSASLTEAAIKWKEMFAKPAGIPLELTMVAAGNNQALKIQSALLRFANLNASALGAVGFKKGLNTDIQVRVSRTQLQGWEKYFPILSSAPVKGAIEMNGRLQGSLSQPDAIEVTLNPLRLENIQGIADWTSTDGKQQIKGPISVDLTSNLRGTYDFKKGIEGSPMRLQSTIKVALPRISYQDSDENTPAAKPNSSADTSSPSPKAPSSLLPNWPILRTGVIAADTSIEQVTFNGIDIKGLHITTRLNQGALNAQAEVGRVFDGKLILKDLRTSLIEAQPKTRGSLSFSGVDVNQATTWFSKEWKDLIKGRGAGSLQFSLPHPSRPDFLDQITAQGRLQLKNGFVSTLQFDQIANQQLAKIPGINGSQQIITKGVAADISSQFALAKKKVQLRDFLFVTPEKNEIRANGTLGLDKSIELDGTAYLSTAPVKGSVREANSDAQGRLVLPIAIKGNLLQPQASFAEKTIQKLIENTAKHELKKNQKKIESKVKETLNKELKKHGKDLEEDLKKGLKNLFKK